LTDDELGVTNQHLRKVLPGLAYPDFIKFIESLDCERFVPMILTYGEKALQSLKVETLNKTLSLVLPVIHTDASNKTDLIASWRNGEHYNTPDHGEFNDIVFVDDKPKHFIGFDGLPNARGFLMCRLGRESLGSSLPSNVLPIRDFSEIVL
jgi:hypothetical protein